MSFPSRRSYDLSFFFSNPPSTDIYPLSLHDALPIWPRARAMTAFSNRSAPAASSLSDSDDAAGDRKSTRLNSSHGSISYAVFCLKKKKKKKHTVTPLTEETPNLT